MESRESQRSTKSVAVAPAVAPVAAASETVLEMIERLRSNCIGYIFPERVVVVYGAFVRMIVYAKYGPAVVVKATFRLRGGRSKELLRSHEEALLLKDEEMALLADVYASAIPLAATLKPAKSIPPATLPDEVLGEMNRHKDPAFRHLTEMTLSELKAVLDAAEIPAAEADGSPLTETTVADAISNALLRERQRRINVLKSSTPSVEHLRRDPDVTKRAATHFYNRTFPKAYEVRSWAEPKDVLRALHRSAFAIAEPENQNNVNLNLNVRCLREPFEMPPGEVKEGWDPYCNIRHSHSGKASTLRK